MILTFLKCRINIDDDVDTIMDSVFGVNDDSSDGESGGESDEASASDGEMDSQSI